MTPTQSKTQISFKKTKSSVTRTKLRSRGTKHSTNILFNYIAKLRNLFFSPKTQEKAVSEVQEAGESGAVQVLHQSEREKHSAGESDHRGEAWKIVKAAVLYGCANDMMEKRGNYITLKKYRSVEKLVARRPPPVPYYIRCPKCRSFMKRYSLINNFTNCGARLKLSSRKQHSDEFEHPLNKERSLTTKTALSTAKS